MSSRLNGTLVKFNYKFPRSLFVPPSLHLRYAFAMPSLYVRYAFASLTKAYRVHNGG